MHFIILSFFRYEAQNIVMLESSEVYSNEINDMGRKLELALSSDIESRERLEAISKCLHFANHDLAGILKTDLDACKLEGESFEVRRKCLQESSERLRRILVCDSIPYMLAPFFGLVMKLSELHLSRLCMELDEEILVSESFGYAETARKITKSLTSECAELADQLYQADCFSVKLISFLERNGVLAPNESPKVFTCSEGSSSSFDYAAVVPRRFDLQSRNKAFSMILSGVTQLVHEGYSSFLEETNSFAQHVVDHSPLVSPISSPRRNGSGYQFSSDRSSGFPPSQRGLRSGGSGQGGVLAWDEAELALAKTS